MYNSSMLGQQRGEMGNMFFSPHLCKSFFNKSGVVGPPVVRVNVFRLGVLACQHATPNGTVTHNSYTKLSAYWDQIFLQATAHSDWLSRGVQSCCLVKCSACTFLSSIWQDMSTSVMDVSNQCSSSILICGL